MPDSSALVSLLGDYLPAWIGAATGLRALQLERQKSRAEDFVTKLLDDPRLSPEALVERMKASENVYELVLEGLDRALSSAAEEKRWLLARVVRAAFEHPDDARLDDYGVLLRTVGGLEPYHVRVLVTISKPTASDPRYAGSRLEGAKSTGFLEVDLHADQRDLLQPVLAVLEREGLITNAASGTYGGGVAWVLTNYGYRLLAFLADRFGEVDLRAAHFSPRYEGPREPGGVPFIAIRNIGIASATLLEVGPLTRDGSGSAPSFHDEPELPLELLPLQEAAFYLTSVSESDRSSYFVTLAWIDGTGTHKDQALVQGSEPRPHLGE